MECRVAGFTALTEWVRGMRGSFVNAFWIPDQVRDDDVQVRDDDVQVRDDKARSIPRGAHAVSAPQKQHPKPIANYNE